MWGRQVYRLSDYELKAASRDGYGEDWPISYSDLAPYYDRVEEFIGVSGSVENVAQPAGRKISAADEADLRRVGAQARGREPLERPARYDRARGNPDTAS